MAKCDGGCPTRHSTLAALFASGRRVVAVASKPAPELTAITADDECDLMLDGFLVFADEPKAAARDSLAQLAALGIEVKVATGDNPKVAEKVCAELGLPSKGTITGAEMETLDDAEFDEAAHRPHHLRPHLTRAEGATDRVIAAYRAIGRASSATASTMRSPCMPPTSESRWTPPPTSPRTPPMWCCWRRIWACSRRVSRRVAASSPTPSSTC